MTKRKLTVAALLLALIAAGVAAAGEGGALRVFERLVQSSPKPFVLVEARGKGVVTNGQGVLISSRGHVLSAGHISWDDKNSTFVDKFHVILRTPDGKVPDGAVHSHKTTFVDKEGTVFHEHSYNAKLLKQQGSRFFDMKDLCVLKVDAKGQFPKLDFFSDDKPAIEIGDVLYLAHYQWPKKKAEPTFLINPVEVVGVVQTTSGFQYLAKGHFRWGSSGGAILKQGRIVGIQSAAYTVNAKDIGELPTGLISFHLVHRSMFKAVLDAKAP